MVKYIFSKKQIDNIITEQTIDISKLQTPTIWNMYKRGKIDSSSVQAFLSEKGVENKDIGQYLKDQMFESYDISNFLTELGWDDNQINKLNLSKLKINKGGKGMNGETYSAKAGGSLGSTGKIQRRCVGPNCPINEEKKRKPMRKYIFTETQLKNIVDNVIEESIILTEQEEEKKRKVAVQKFLNAVYKQLNLTEDGLIGPETKKAIEHYQSKIGVYPVDGVWGPETEKKMPENHRKIFDAYIKESDDIFDRMVKLFTSGQQQ